MGASIESRVVAVPDEVYGSVDFLVHETGDPADPALVFLHGSGPGVNALSNWEGVIQTLGERYHCVAPDMAGFGDSTHPDPPPAGLPAFTEFRVRTLLALFAELELTRIVLVGNSMGGLISLLIASQQPSLVDRMILMGSAGGAAEVLPGLRQVVSFYDDPTADNMESLLRLFLSDPSIFGSDLRSIAEDRLPNALRPEVERSHRATFDFTHGMIRFSDEDLARITTPTLLIHGADDRIISPDASRDLASRLANAELELVPDTGHWIQIESEDSFLRSLDRFLAD